MLQLSIREDRSLLILTYLGCRQGINTSAKMIAERFSMNLDYTVNILKELTRGGLLKSKRGPAGGYSLTKATDDISVADVLEALTGTPFAFSECCTSDVPLCGVSAECYVLGPIREMHRQILEILQKTTIANFQAHVTNRSLRPSFDPTNILKAK